MRDAQIDRQDRARMIGDAAWLDVQMDSVVKGEPPRKNRKTRRAEARAERKARK